MTTAKTLMVLAAGIGSRYGGLKQIDPVGPNGEIVLDYSVFDALRAGFDRVVFVIRKDIESDFRSAIGSRFESRMDTEYAFQQLDLVPAGFTIPPERRKPWGTGHAVLVARHLIDGPFAVINADDFYGAASYRLLADFLNRVEVARPASFAMVGFRLMDTLSEHGTVSRGVCECDKDSRLIRIDERPAIRKQDVGPLYTGDESTSMNFWGFTPQIFEAIEKQFRDFLRDHGSEPKSELYIPAVVDTMIRRGEAVADVIPGGGPWFGITYKEDKPAVMTGIRRLIDEGHYPSPLWT